MTDDEFMLQEIKKKVKQAHSLFKDISWVCSEHSVEFDQFDSAQLLLYEAITLLDEEISYMKNIANGDADEEEEQERRNYEKRRKYKENRLYEEDINFPEDPINFPEDS